MTEMIPAQVHQDIEDIGKAVNTDAIITPRYGAPFKSLPMIAREIYADVLDLRTNKADQATTYTKAEVDTTFAAYAGGRKAYTTLALAQAAQSSLPANTAIEVTNDGANNGTYQWNGTTLTKSAYDPLTQAKAFTEAKTALIEGVVDLGNYADVKSYNGNNGVWITNDSNYLGRMININPTYSYQVTASATADSHVLVFNSINPVAITHPSAEMLLRRTTIPKGTTQTISSLGSDTLWVSSKDGTNNRLPQKVVQIKGRALTTSDTISNIAYTSSDKLASSSLVREISEKVTSINDSLRLKGASDFELLDITLNSGRYVSTDHTLTADQNSNPSVSGVEIVVAAGDIIEFDYHPIVGSNLYQKIANNKAYPILTNNHFAPNDTRHFKYTSPVACTLQIAAVYLDTVRLNGAVVDYSRYTELRAYGRYAGAYLPPPSKESTHPDKGVSGRVKVNKGDVVRIVGGIKGQPAVNMPSLTTPGYYLHALSIPADYPSDTIEWVATENVSILLSGYLSTKFYIKRAASLRQLLLDKRIPLQAHELDTINLPAKETVFATHLNYILRMEIIDGIENIAISTDLGGTYTYIVNTTEGAGITNYHFFTDGTIMLSTEKKVYWTSDYVTLNESTLLDEDGSPFVAGTNAHHFFGQQNSDKPMFIDGHEVYAWGDYTIANTLASVWFTTDFGRTVKRAIKMNGGSIDGVALAARHVHKVYFHKKLQRFYVMTGDAGDECMLIEGILNPVAGTWQWTILGQGDFFKFGNMWEDDHYTYVTTDYTIAEQKNNWGIFRVGHNYLADKTKYRLAYKADNTVWNVGSPYRFIADGNGNKLLMPELLGLSYITVATEGFNFKKVRVEPVSVLSFIIGANDNGDIYCKADYYARNLGVNAGQFLTGGTINLTKALRAAGLTNFMTGEQHFKSFINVSE